MTKTSPRLVLLLALAVPRVATADAPPSSGAAPVSSVPVPTQAPAAPPQPSADLRPAPPVNQGATNAVGGTTVPAPHPSGAWASYLIPLRVMLERHLITQAEYESAMRDLADTTGLRASDQTNLVVGKWSTTLYGFAEADYIYDTTQSYIEFPGNTQIARPGTYAGDHSRMQFSPRFSRIGFRMRAPETHSIRASAVVETDFLQSSAASSGLAVTQGAATTSNAFGSEQSFYTNPVLRIRHMYLRLETY